MKKKVVVFLLSTAMVAVMGCGSGTAVAPSENQEASAKEETIEKENVKQEKAAVTELVYWKSYRVDQEAVDKFNAEHPDIHVSAEVFPDHASTLQKIQVQASAGSAQMPNIIQLDTCMTPTVDGVAPLLDLKPYLDLSETLKLDDFYETFQEEAYIGDKLAGLHVIANCDVLFFNKEIFQQAGLDVDNPPKTWDEVTAAGKAIQENCSDDIIPFAYTGITGDYYEQFSWEWQAMVQSAGGELFNKDYSKPEFNSEPGIAALQFLVGAVLDTKIATLNYPDKGFENGKVGMYMDGTWSINNYQEALGDTLGVGLMPGRQESKVMVGGDQIMIVDATDKEVNDAAFTFLTFMLSEEVVIKSSKDQGELVCQKAIAQSPEYQEYLAASGAMQTAQSAMEHASYRARVPWYDEWSQLVYAVCEPALYGEISCQEALAELETKTIEIIKKYQ